jgi:hypothetical protein
MEKGYWILDIRYWILDIGYWILDVGVFEPGMFLALVAFVQGNVVMAGIA